MNLVTLLSFRCFPFTKCATECLLERSGSNCEFLLVDNGSEGEVKKYFDQIKNNKIHVIHNSTNLGCAGGWNKIVNFALNDKRYTHISLISTDVFMCNNWLDRIMKGFNDYPKYSVLAPIETNNQDLHETLRPYHSKSNSAYSDLSKLSSSEIIKNTLDNVFDGSFDKKSEEFINKFKYLTFLGAGYSCPTFKREVFEKVGYFDEWFHPCGCEDADYESRMVKQGINTGKTGYAFAHHWCSVTFLKSGVLPGSALDLSKDIAIRKGKETKHFDCVRATCEYNDFRTCKIDIKDCQIGCPQYRYDNNYPNKTRIK